MYEVKWSKSRSVVSDSLRPYWLYSTWNSPGQRYPLQNTEVGSLSLLQGIFPTQGSNLGLLNCRQILYTAEPQGKPKNTGVGIYWSLSLLQRIFLTQELNWGLLHCRRILYQLSYQGSHVCVLKLLVLSSFAPAQTQSHPIHTVGHKWPLSLPNTD